MLSPDTPAVVNPPQNALGSGLSIDKVESAIAKSGYPLQTHVTNILRGLGLAVSPEWSFIDRDTGELRSIDLLATMELHESGDQTRARPSLSLLIECKMSEMPFVFFTGESMPWHAKLPFLAGQRKDDFTIYTDDSRSTWNCDLQQALSLRKHPFFWTPKVAYTFSKCHRKGSDLLLSGEEVYNGIILPLVKSLHHYKIAEKPPTTAHYFDLHYSLPVAVLDAPMLAFEEEKATLVPWVRLIRHEAGDSNLGKNDRGLSLPVDFVHRDYLHTYVTDHLLPSANDFSSKTLAHAEEAAECEGFIANMEANWYADYEAHLKPYKRPNFLGKS